MIRAQHEITDSNLARCCCCRASASSAEVCAFAAGGSRWGAHGGAVVAARRLHCGARPGVVSPNSLRSLRSLRSDRRRQVRLRSALRAPTPVLRSSSPHKSPPANTACREIHGYALSRNATTVVAKPRAGRCGRACEAPRSAGLVAARASALRCLTSPRLFERSERSERSEFAAGHETEHRRAVGPQGRPPKWRARTGPPAALRAPTVEAERRRF
jgi:hypothetical protein